MDEIATSIKKKVLKKKLIKKKQRLPKTNIKRRPLVNTIYLNSVFSE
jgi:hypothetical protein